MSKRGTFNAFSLDGGRSTENVQLFKIRSEKMKKNRCFKRILILLVLFICFPVAIKAASIKYNNQDIQINIENVKFLHNNIDGFVWSLDSKKLTFCTLDYLCLADKNGNVKKIQKTEINNKYKMV